MDKYYTPEIEEIFNSPELIYKENIHINPYVCRDETKIVNLKEDFDLNIVRVKYLDKDDIESLGWFHRYDDFSFGEFIKSKNGEVDYHLTFDYENKSLIIGLYNNEDTELYDNIFIGTIKNKSELKKLLKQLQIG